VLKPINVVVHNLSKNPVGFSDNEKRNFHFNLKV
jgi:hypothetical protein